MIISCDKDFLQIPKLTIKSKKKTGIKYIDTTVESSMKSLAKQFLLGDRIDNIPGVPHVGTITADKMLEDKQFKSLKEVYSFIKDVYREHNLLFYFPSNMMLLRLLTKYNVPLKELATVLEYDCLNCEHSIEDHTLIPYLNRVFTHIERINNYRTEAYNRQGKLK